MTLPQNINLPYHSNRIISEDPNDLSEYMRDLIKELEGMYRNLADAINGNIRADYDITQSAWTPVLAGSTNAGSFTYDHQVGYSLRRGIVVDVWFDVQWTAVGGATGNLILNLPYKVANVSTTNTKPFVGIVQPGNLTFSAGTDIVINGIPNTFNGEFWTTGNGVATGNQAIVDSGSGQLIGHLRYIGRQDER